MTSPLHGGGRRFESGRAHFFLQFKSADADMKKYRPGIYQPGKKNELFLVKTCEPDGESQVLAGKQMVLIERHRIICDI